MTTVIFDGQCAFCRSCVEWVKNRYQINALANQEIDPAMYGITREQCDKSVVVIDSQNYFGASAIALLLARTGHPFMAKLLRTSGSIGEFCYRYVASHRDGRLVELLHWIVKSTL